MELRELLTTFRRRIWLLVIGVVLGIVTGFAVSKIQTPIYEASTKVLIARGRQQSATNILSLSDQQLVLTYQQLLKTQPILDEVGSRLEADIDPKDIKDGVESLGKVVMADLRKNKLLR